MADVFVSSVQSGFEDVRAAARAAVEHYGHRAVMAETVGAAAVSPQRALLDRVRMSDIVLVLIGPNYGDRQESGLSATEEEFDEARRSGRDILVLVQDGTRDEAQADFLRRATHGWEDGILRDSFQDANDVGLVIVRALRNLELRGTREELEPAAQTRAQELAGDTSRGGFGEPRALVRVVLVPLLPRPLLDAVSLGDATLGDDLANVARAARLVPQSLGITARVSAAGIRLEVGEQHSSGYVLTVGASGEIVAEASAAGSGALGSMRIVPERVDAAVRGALAFAEGSWHRVDPGNQVQDAAVTIAVPNAQSLSWGPDRDGNSISMGGTFSMPAAVVIPQPAAVLRRADLGRQETTTRLVAELERVFLDAGAVDAR